MASHVTLLCDYLFGNSPCGQPARANAVTVLGIDDQFTEIDLCPEHQGLLLEAVAPFASIGRTVAPPTARNVRKVLRTHAGATFTVKDVRRWLIEEGREVSHTGKVPEALIEEYRTAHAH